MLPNFVIIGAQKSASSFLQICLADHPDIYLPPDEISFFESPDYELTKLTKLEEIFDGRHEKCLGIKRPSYLGKPEVPARIHFHLPEAKLIAVLRNPVDRAVSAYFHNIKYGFIPPINIEKGMRKLISDISFSSKYKRSPEILEFGYYYKYLSQYNKYMEDGKLLVFLHEDILTNALSCIQKIYEFLEVSSGFVPKTLNSRPQQVLYNIYRLKVLSYRNKLMYNYNKDKTRLFTKKMTKMDKFFSDTLTSLDQKFLSKYLSNMKPNISVELRSQLYTMYARDIDNLEGYLNRDLSAWKVANTL